MTVEDSILSKLEWHARSLADQQYRDALSVAAIHRGAFGRHVSPLVAIEIGAREILDRLLAEID